MKAAAKTRNYSEVDEAIRTKVTPYLYNGGRGKMVHVAHMVINRNKDRPKHKMLYMLKPLDDPESFNTEKWLESRPEFQWSPDKDQSLFREVCWNLEERGAVGESILHLCFLNSSSIHADLAKRLLRIYPKLINDYYVSEDYYGENVLHMAIVNEDPATVKFLLDNGANYHERCCGAFMSPEDQKGSRTDSLTQEWVNVDPNTNYEGYVYWGEYPLSFAACLGQEECYRLILGKGADPNKQDTNGNTVLHMLVIYNKMEMFDVAYELGADLNIKNVLQLTPLTLAAKLAHKDMFDHIVKIQREIYWQLGGVVCAAYKLPQIDTIHPKNGGIQTNSVLNLVVFGDKEAHLDLMEGVLVDLLHAKWNTFVKARFYKQFITFGFYFLVSLLCFTIRPSPPLNNYSAVTPPSVRNVTGNRTGTRILNRTEALLSSFPSTLPLDDLYLNFSTLSNEVDSTSIPPSSKEVFEEKINAESYETPRISTFATTSPPPIKAGVKDESAVVPLTESEQLLAYTTEQGGSPETEQAEQLSDENSETTPLEVDLTTFGSPSQMTDPPSLLDGNEAGSEERIKREKQGGGSLDDRVNSKVDGSRELVDMQIGNRSPSRKDGGISPEVLPTFQRLETSTSGIAGIKGIEGQKPTDLVVMEVEIKGDRVSLIAPRRGKRAVIRNRGNRHRHSTPSAKSTEEVHSPEEDELFLNEKDDVENFAEDLTGEELAKFKYRKKKPGGFGKPGAKDEEPEGVETQPDEYIYEYVDSVENETFVPDRNSTLGEGITTIATSPRTRTVTPPPLTTTTPTPVKKKRFNETDPCRLWKISGPLDYVRMGAEVFVVLGAILYLLGAAREGFYLGRKMFVENLSTAPSRVLFLISCWLTLAMVGLRFQCMPRAEDNVAVLVMLFTGPYFLFFCRGFKKVGPFVVMIYRMIMGDLLRFVTIYAVFIMGFSQAYYIVFLSFDNQEANPMPNAAESVMAMFLMSMNDFDSMFEAFAKTDHEAVAKMLFVIFMAIVAVLLVNLLIAMMGNTYTKISECANEWQRQWARIVLVVERGVPPSERLKQQIAYSQPTVSGHRALVLRIPQTEDDKEEIEDIRELNLNHQKFLERKRKAPIVLCQQNDM